MKMINERIGDIEEVKQFLQYTMKQPNITIECQNRLYNYYLNLSKTIATIQNTIIIIANQRERILELEKNCNDLISNKVDPYIKEKVNEFIDELICELEHKKYEQKQ